MLKNYLLSCLRHLRLHKSFTAINVLGLSIGMSAAIVIFMIVFYETSFDHKVKDHDRVYRVVVDAHFGGVEGHSASIPGAAALAIPREIAGVEQAIPVFYFPFDGSPKITLPANRLQPDRIIKKQTGIIFTTSAYPDLLNLKWLAGSPAAALSVPYQVVLTAARAERYFPGIPYSALPGKRIKYNEDFSAIVSGVVSDPGPQFSMTAEEFVSWPTATQTSLADQFMMNRWDDWMAYAMLYVKLEKGKNVADVTASIRNLVKKQTSPVPAGQPDPYTLTLQPLNDVHFNINYSGYHMRLADRRTMTGLLFIGGFLLLLGSINFINLTTADAARRAREIGVRKTLGSSRRQLVWLFLGETLFITSIAAALSLVFVPLLFGFFAGFLPPGLRFEPLREPGLWIFLVVLVLSVTLLSGLYPAFVLSGFRPASVLKNQVASGGETRFAWIRKSLTVSQFVVAQFFLIATLVVAKQLHYGLTMDMGMNKTAILSFGLPRDAGDSAGLRLQSLLNRLKAMPETNLVAAGGLAPAGQGVAIVNVGYAQKKDLKAEVQLRYGQPGYISIYGIKLVAGRNVQASDTAREILINESYAKLLGFARPVEAIGQRLEWNHRLLPIVGIMRDFHASDARSHIWPMMFTEGGGNTVHLLLQENGAKTGSWKTGIAKMQKAFLETYPETDFTYSFYDQQISAMYERDEQLAGLLKWATGLTVFISCLGLLGLVIYTTRTRLKEISIRKVLGASVTQIVSILSSGFLRLIIIAFLIAAPIAWWAAGWWLGQFAYRTPLSWWLFAAGGGGLMLAALSTLSLQTIKAARANPVKSLKTE